MADLFRMMLSQDEMLVPVKNEIDVAKKYLALEALRLDNRLTVNWDIGKFPRKAVMPVLTLQPLLENAIRHGIEELPAGGAIDMRLWEENDRIHIRVANPSPQNPAEKGKIHSRPVAGQHPPAAPEPLRRTGHAHECRGERIVHCHGRTADTRR
jgi:two-component system, LytTR family, sensor histidine kinase AlgZ